MNEKKTKERIELEKRIQEKIWFGLLPKYTRESLLKQPSSYLDLLLKQEIAIVTTNEEIGFGFGFDAEMRPVIRLAEFSATSIGVKKLNKLKLYPNDKMRFIIKNINLMQRPLSDKNKRLIEMFLEKIGDQELWDLGVMIEESTRHLQLRIETGRIETPYLPNLVVDRKEEAEIPGIMLRNYRWLWEQIVIHSKTAKLHNSVSPLYFAEAIRSEEEKPLRLYQIECECGKMTALYAIGPFSALKLAGTFPFDDPERYRFWEHIYGCRTTADEYCYCIGNLLVRERPERLKMPDLLDELCPVCEGKGDDPKASHEYELKTNITETFRCRACRGIGRVTVEEKGRILFRQALENVRSGESGRMILYSLLPHLAKKDRDEVFDWSKVGEYYATKIEPQSRVIALPVPGKVLVITQETVCLEDVYCSGDRFPDKETVLTPLILEVKDIEDIQEPEKIEFLQEAEAFIQNKKIRSVEQSKEKNVKETTKVRYEDLSLKEMIKTEYAAGLNPNYREYIFPGKAFNITIRHLSKGLSVELVPEVGKDRQELIRKILSVPGVTDICLQGASISVMKEKTFSWEDIEPRLRALFEEHKLGDTSLLLKDILPEKAPEVVAGEEEENGTKKEYHTTALLTISSIENFSQQFWEQKNVRHNREKTIKTIGRRGYEILDLIFRNELISEVFIKPYRLSVRRNKNASWAEVDSMVMGAIIKCAEKYKASE